MSDDLIGKYVDGIINIIEKEPGVYSGNGIHGLISRLSQELNLDPVGSVRVTLALMESGKVEAKEEGKLYPKE
ncbi:MAG: hypothetical protein JW754_03120 [Candidatus Aenigmarchaeota archaeon]|nr:hypothetical protein [Candidatus Aenigmarchaeota archaeon]